MALELTKERVQVPVRKTAPAPVEEKRISFKDAADLLKTELTILDVVEKYGYTPDRTGYIQCPFHQGDRHGSLKLYPSNNSWYCYGCNKGGSVIDFVMNLFGLDFKQAVARMCSEFGIDAPGTGISASSASRLLQAAQKAAEQKKYDVFRDELAELGKEEEKLVKWRSHFADIVVHGERYIDDPVHAPDEWVQSCIALERIDQALENIDDQVSEVKELERIARGEQYRHWYNKQDWSVYGDWLHNGNGSSN